MSCDLVWWCKHCRVATPPSVVVTLGSIGICPTCAFPRMCVSSDDGSVCPQCGGEHTEPCWACAGSGLDYEDCCDECGGKGTVDCEECSG